LAKDPKSFARIVITSIAGRLLLILVVITIFLKITQLHMEAFLVSFFVWYFVFQILEVISLNKLSIRKI
jgi:hypothetical protein